MRIYEELFIIRPDANEEEVEAIGGQLTAAISATGGAVDKIEKWGVRKLAYRLQKKNEGYYVLIQFQGGAETVKELERRLRVNDAVMKFLTVRIDEKLKWLERRRKAREKRAAKKPQAPAAPALPAQEAAPVPGAPAGREE